MVSKVLVIDDDSAVRSAFKLILEEDGYLVREAENDLEGIEMTFAEPPDLLIALSGYGQAKDLDRSQEAGFDHHLVKPLNFTILCDLLSKHVAQPSA
ncbi:MAG: hypothetical protein PHG00_09325 [Methylococcales bacterium]|nr:hypothetical protein [Methylococcales bacterium]